MNKEEGETNSLRDLIQNLTANMESNFAKLHEELCSLRQEMKEKIDMLKRNIKGVEKSVDEILATIEDMKEATKALKDSKTVQEDELQELRALLTKIYSCIIQISRFSIIGKRAAVVKKCCFKR